MQSKPVKIANPSEHHSSMVEQLIATNVTLQNKMVDLLIGTKELNENVNKLVHLFTDAAAHIRTGKYEDPLIEKLNDLLEQNKSLAKGLLMLEEYVKTKQGSAAQFKHPANEF